MNSLKKNIYTNGTYEHKNPDWFKEDSAWKAGIVNKLIDKHGLKPGNITEIGCGVGELLFILSELKKEIQHFIGYDIAPFAIDAARKKQTDRVRFYLGDFKQVMHEKTDLLLAIDVVEHIPDYYNFLQGLRQKSSQFIFHIPLDLSCRTLFKPSVILQQRKDAGHLHYFSKEHVFWALEDCGFTIVDYEYTLSETDRNKARTFKALVKKLGRRCSFFLSKELSVKIWGGYSIMLFCTGNE